MNLIAEIYESDLALPADPARPIRYALRKAARAIVERGDEIALLYVANGQYHKLPGGGIEPNEDRIAALKREVREEVGIAIEVTGEIGCIIEYRDQFEQLQISDCFRSTYQHTIGAPRFTEEEIADGFALVWVKKNLVASIFASDHPTNYVGKFIHHRDCEFVRHWLES